MAALTLTLAGSLAAAPAEAVDRYSVANGCYALQNADSGRTVPGAERVRLQATTLGRYLLYRPDRTFLAAAANGAVAPASEPSPAADWRVRGRRPPERVRALARVAAGRVLLRVRFAPARGCAVYPEAALDATGTPAKGATSYGRGARLRRGPHALDDLRVLRRQLPLRPAVASVRDPVRAARLRSIEGPQGTAAPVQNTLNYGNPAQPHDTRGYPKLTAWGSTKQPHLRGHVLALGRARLGSRPAPDGDGRQREPRAVRAAGQPQVPTATRWTTVRRGFKAIRELQDYVDAQAGGPGKGFFQIVTDPYEARRVINQGRMAVVLEIEISEPFDCRSWEQPTCDKA